MIITCTPIHWMIKTDIYCLLNIHTHSTKILFTVSFYLCNLLGPGYCLLDIAHQCITFLGRGEGKQTNSTTTSQAMAETEG